MLRYNIDLCIIITYEETKDSNASLLSGLISGLGAIIAILLSISFSERSNEQSFGSSVLPYIIVNKAGMLPDTYVAFEYFSDKEKLFSYLRLKSIGLGPANKMGIGINNFSSLLLDKDYLQPNVHHVQEFDANITRHLDRTNFTLFSRKFENTAFKQG